LCNTLQQRLIPAGLGSSVTCIHHIVASVQERRTVARVVLPQSAQPEERQPVRTGRDGTTMITKSMSIILLLMAALLLGTIASIHAQSQPRLQLMSFDN